MNYKVLYRKYRPTTFDEVIGQNNTIELLKDSILNNKISHAYIFSGPRGTGKTSTAKIFAKAINCSNVKDSNPCNECENCKNFLVSSDIYEIDAASNNGVDQIREIIENIKLAPINSKYKIYIIDEVHMLSISAFNALLLTLEEPPSHVVFILATTDIEDVPITVLSRCQRLDFHKISNADIINLLRKVANLENISIDEDAITEIADYADGGMRDALSILDQLSKSSENITQEVVLSSIGLVSSKKIQNVLDAVDSSNIDEITNFCEYIRNNLTDFKMIIKRLIDNLKLRGIDCLKNGSNTDNYKKYKNLSFELASLIYKNNVNVDSYNLLEMCLLDYVNKAPEIKKNISREIFLENPKVEKSPKKRLGNNFSSLVDIRVNNCFVYADKKILEANKLSWNEFIENLDNKKLKGMLMDTNIVLSSNDIMIIKTDFDEKAEIINNNVDNIANLYNNVFSKFYKFAAVSDAYWQDATTNYKENIKNNIPYKIIAEPVITNDDAVDEIFTKDKIEIV